jgi:hypothetical protein
MNINSDYTISILAEQRRADLMAEAAQDRLAKLAHEGHTPTWRRLLARVHGGAEGRRSHALATGQHRVAH